MKATSIAWLAAMAAAGAAGTVLAQPAGEPAAPPAPAQAPMPTPMPPTPPAPVAPAGEAADVVSLIEKACLPLIQGDSIKSVAAANGLKRSRDEWVLLLPGVQRISLAPPTTANPNLCTLTINLEIDQSGPILDALTGWAAMRTPPLTPLDKAYQSGPGATNWSWSADTAQLHEGMVFRAQKTPDGKPVGKDHDVATLLFSRSGQ